MQIQTDLAQPGNLYAEYGTPDGQRGSDDGKYSFVWPASHQLRALAAAAKLQPRPFAASVAKNVAALDQYWIKLDGLGGYAVLPGGEERYYDDNAVMLLALLDAYEATRQRQILARAAETLKFVASGEAKTAGGGIRQHETKDGPVVVCATGPATVGALRLYAATRDRRFLQAAERWYGFLTSGDERIRDSADGLYQEVGQGKRAYLSAFVLQASLLLYQQSKDEKYLTEAQRIAASAVANWITPSGALNETGQWGGSDLCEALLALYEIDKDRRWYETVHGMLRYLREKCRDRQGRYGEHWQEDISGQTLPKFHLLHMAPAAQALLHAATVKPPADETQPTKVAGSTPNPKGPKTVDPDEAFRNWSSADGKFSVEASLIRFADGVAYLRRKDNGKVIRVPFDKLSEADQAFLTRK